MNTKKTKRAGCVFIVISTKASQKKGWLSHQAICLEQLWPKVFEASQLL
jgi:hypothetical protein